MSDIKISVVIPTLNEEKYLKNALESLKKQTYKNFEIIISDGASTDKTVELAKKYTSHIISKKGNVCVGRDLGLRSARGEIVVCADADSVYPANYLQNVWEIFEKNPGIVAATGPVHLVDCPRWASMHWIVSRSLIELVYKLSGKVVYAFSLNLAYKKDVLLRAGGYDTRLEFGGDELDIISKLQKVGKMIYSKTLYPTTNGRRFKAGFVKYYTKFLFRDYILNYFFRKYFHLSFITSEPVR